MATACPFSATAAGYLIDTLDEAERASFQRHVRLCRSCRQEVDDLTPVVRLIQAMNADTSARKEPDCTRDPAGIQNADDSKE